MVVAVVGGGGILIFNKFTNKVLKYLALPS